ncbi:MAG: 50S ribosomal protein L13 [Firmicutes bacterium ADurb.Bin193]|nr:MAG: 50S ribosomal protein L13 [Firmicutes bacterium ADurb.Bin193]
MSTFMAKAKELDRQWHIIDAAGKPLGRVAAAAAVILRGKHKPTYTPHTDCGDFVIIINTDKAILTGNKLENKMWYRYTGYSGGLKAVKYRDLMATRSDKAMELAVWGMLPHNTLGRASFRKLHVYKNDQHKHQAQKPVVWDREIK